MVRTEYEAWPERKNRRKGQGKFFCTLRVPNYTRTELKSNRYKH